MHLFDCALVAFFGAVVYHLPALSHALIRTVAPDFINTPLYTQVRNVFETTWVLFVVVVLLYGVTIE